MTKHLISLLLLLSSCNSPEAVKRPWASDSGYVPDHNTAERIAEAIWLPIYGESVLDEKPYQSRLVGDSVWVVEGTLPKDMKGGTAYIEIMRSDARVLKVIHEK